MKRSPLVALVLTLAGTGPLACSDGDTPSGTPDGAPPGGDGGSAPVPCPSGANLIQFSTTPPASTPALQAIQLPNLHPSTIIVPAKDGSADSMRFDLCQTAGGPQLQAILLRGESVTVAARFVVDGTITAPVSDFVDIPEGKVFETRLPPSAITVEGLTQAIAGDLRPLRIRVLGDMGMLVRGHDGFLAVGRGNVGASSIEYTSLYVLVGGLAPGNVFQGLRCPLGEGLLETTFRLDTAQFEVQACTFLGGGITTGYRIHRLTVQDTNPALMEQHRRKLEFTTEAEVAGVMNYKWNHHNACDSFHLALGHADYAASSAPAAGCGSQVPNAPPRDINENPPGPVQYRIRYYAGTWRDGSIAGCHHHLFCR